MNSTASKINVEGVMVISEDISPEHIIERILDVQTLPDSNLFSGTIKGYPWKFETKYYSAEVNLYSIIDKTPLEQDFADSIQASVCYFDSSKAKSFENLLRWISIYDNITPEVRIIVCNNYNEDIPALLRKNILNWCAKNQFELVELNPLDENDEDDFIPEPKGYARVVQALQAHTWGNLVMKDRTSTSRKEKPGTDNSKEKKNAENAASALCNDTGSKEACNVKTDECGKNSSAEENVKKVKVGNDELSLEEKWVNNIVSGDDPDGESFEALFSKFASMKERAEGLTGDARKRYAEEVAIAFWKAMGGDEDEIEGLDD